MAQPKECGFTVYRVACTDAKYINTISDEECPGPEDCLLHRIRTGNAAPLSTELVYSPGVRIPRGQCEIDAGIAKAEGKYPPQNR